MRSTRSGSITARASTRAAAHCSRSRARARRASRSRASTRPPAASPPASTPPAPGAPRFRGLELAGTLAADLIARRLRAVFFKQFRAAEDGTKAALQQIVESAYTVHTLEVAFLTGTYRLEVHPLDSMPLTRELGLESQELKLAHRARLDFRVGGAKVLWSAP